MVVFNDARMITHLPDWIFDQCSNQDGEVNLKPLKR